MSNCSFYLFKLRIDPKFCPQLSAGFCPKPRNKFIMIYPMIQTMARSHLGCLCMYKGFIMHMNSVDGKWMNGSRKMHELIDGRASRQIAPVCQVFTIYFYCTFSHIWIFFGFSAFSMLLIFSDFSLFLIFQT